MAGLEITTVDAIDGGGAGTATAGGSAAGTGRRAGAEWTHSPPTRPNYEKDGGKLSCQSLLIIGKIRYNLYGREDYRKQTIQKKIAYVCDCSFYRNLNIDLYCSYLV